MVIQKKLSKNNKYKEKEGVKRLKAPYFLFCTKLRLDLLKNKEYTILKEKEYWKKWKSLSEKEKNAYKIQNIKEKELYDKFIENKIKLEKGNKSNGDEDESFNKKEKNLELKKNTKIYNNKLILKPLSTN